METRSEKGEEKRKRKGLEEKKLMEKRGAERREIRTET